MRKTRVFMACHDAGGAEILSSWYEQNRKKYAISIHAEGPARRIFKRDFGPLRNSPLRIIANFTGGDFVLCGSSLEADTEREAVREARRNGIKSITVLDHWDLYRERFGDSTGWKKNLPDSIWVMDKYAYDLAIGLGFPKNKIEIVDNPYFAKIRRIFKPVSRKRSSRSILYICEPYGLKLKATYGDKAGEYDDEIEIMDAFLQGLEACRMKFDQLTLRLHPREPGDKYDSIISRHAKRDFRISLSKEPSLIGDLEKHGVVVGIESMGLVNAMILGRKTFSYLSGKQRDIALPHKEIKRIMDVSQIFK